MTFVNTLACSDCTKHGKHKQIISEFKITGCIVLQGEESDFNDEEENILHPSNTDVSVITSEGGQSQITWNMGPYLKEILEKFQEGESILKKQEKKKRTKKK